MLLPALRARERERAAKRVAGFFEIGRAHILLVWPKGPRREAEDSPTGQRAPQRGRSGVHPQREIWREGVKRSPGCPGTDAGRGKLNLSFKFKRSKV